MDTSLQDELIEILAQRFASHRERHREVDWRGVLAKLQASPGKLQVLAEMQRSGGEPDVIGVDVATGMVTFCDCSPESPEGRRSLCYDRAALDARKANKPAGNVVDLAAAIGIDMLTEQQYRGLQALGEFDRKTSSWVATPPEVRDLGGALFCDRRFGRVFVYHNGAESYYAGRGFRGRLEV